MSSWLIDMDGVLVHEGLALNGAREFLGRLEENGIPHLILTNNSIFTPRDLAARLQLIRVRAAQEPLRRIIGARAPNVRGRIDHREAQRVHGREIRGALLGAARQWRPV